MNIKAIIFFASLVTATYSTFSVQTAQPQETKSGTCKPCGTCNRPCSGCCK